jgi:hypothetical protein
MSRFGAAVMGFLQGLILTVLAIVLWPLGAVPALAILFIFAVFFYASAFGISVLRPDLKSPWFYGAFGVAILVVYYFWTTGVLFR